VPWVDAYSVWRGPTNHIVHHHHQVFSTLSIGFPVPGEDSSANLGLPDILFFGLFLAAAARFGLRVLPTWVLLVGSFGATFEIAVRSAFSSAHATDSAETSTPQTVSALEASVSPIVPIPQ